MLRFTRGEFARLLSRVSVPGACVGDRAGDRSHRPVDTSAKKIKSGQHFSRPARTAARRRIYARPVYIVSGCLNSGRQQEIRLRCDSRQACHCTGDPKPARADSRWLPEAGYEPAGSEKMGISRPPLLCRILACA